MKKRVLFSLIFKIIRPLSGSEGQYIGSPRVRGMKCPYDSRQQGQLITTNLVFGVYVVLVVVFIY